MDTDKGAITIRLLGRVEKRTALFKRGSSHEAKCGPVEVVAKTRAEAVEALAKATAKALDGWGSPVVMWSLDGRECWIAFPHPGGSWGYKCLSATDRFNVRDGAMIHPSSIYDTREDCLRHMREHWYDLNVADIVTGIIGLCTDLRQWSCPKCKCLARGHAPYKCGNPACGADAPAFNW